MKKHRWVILTLLIVAVAIIAIKFFSPEEPERDFHGTFITHINPKIVQMHDFN